MEGFRLYNKRGVYYRKWSKILEREGGRGGGGLRRTEIKKGNQETYKRVLKKKQGVDMLANNCKENFQTRAKRERGGTVRERGSSHGRKVQYNIVGVRKFS